MSPAYGSSEAKRLQQDESRNSTALSVVSAAPAIDSGFQESFDSATVPDAGGRLLQTLYVGDERVESAAGSLSHLAVIGGFFVDFAFAVISTGLRIHCRTSSAVSFCRRRRVDWSCCPYRRWHDRANTSALRTLSRPWRRARHPAQRRARDSSGPSHLHRR